MQPLRLGILLAAITAAQPLPPMVDWVHSLELGYAGISITGTAMDVDGSYFVAGSHVVARGTTSSLDLFVMKYDTASDRVLYVASFGGSKDDYSGAIAVDSFGNPHITVQTDSSDFPGAPNDDGKARGVLVRLNGQDGTIQKAALMPSRVFPWKIAIDSFDAVVIGGIAGALDLPSFPGVAIPGPLTTVHPSDMLFFVAKYDLNQSKFLFATFLPRVDTTLMPYLFVRPNGDLLTILLDGTMVSVNSLGTIVNYARRAPLRLQAATLDSEQALHIAGTDDKGVLTVQKLRTDGSVEFEAKWKDNAPSVVAMTANPGFGTHLFLSTPRAGFPTLNSTNACSVDGGGFAMFSENGTVVNASHFSLAFLPNSAALSPVNRRIYTLTNGDALARIHPGVIPVDKTTIGCVTHGAIFTATPLTPGMLMTTFGNKLGPSAGVSFQLENGRVPMNVAGTSITVNGQPAAVLYAQDAQVNFVVPWGTPLQQFDIPVCIRTNMGESCRSLGSVARQPAGFQHVTSSAALNQDLAPNSSENAAARGSVVALYVTGTGVMEGPLVDGGVAGAALQRLPGPVTATFASPQVVCGFMRICAGPPIPAEVLYAGSAPGLVLGVTQINVRVPESSPIGLRSMEIKLRPDDPAFGAAVWVK